MRPFLLPIFLLPAYALQIPSIFVDFVETQSVVNDTLVSVPAHDLLKRDGNCPINYNSCSTLAAADGGACCTIGSFCTLDNVGNIACCPNGAFCTGTVTTDSTATGPIVLGGSTTATTTTVTTTGPVTVITNAYFPFPIIPTSYVNSAACNSAYSACQANYAACTNDLQGVSFGVTIVAPNGGGVTVAPTALNLGVSSATSICSSLSSQACYNIQSADCARFTGTSSQNQFVNPTGTANGAAGPIITVPPLLAAAVVGWGVLGRLA